MFHQQYIARCKNAHVNTTIISLTDANAKSFNQTLRADSSMKETSILYHNLSKRELLSSNR